MKKLLSYFIAFVCIIALLFSVQGAFGNCEYSEAWSINSNLDNCLSWSDLVDPGDWLIESGIKSKLIYWTNQLWGFLGLLAVGAIVYGGLMMTLSWGEDERIKKGKDIVKWAMLWFLGLIVASWIVRVIVEVMFSVAW